MTVGCVRIPAAGSGTAARRACSYATMRGRPSSAPTLASRLRSLCCHNGARRGRSGAREQAASDDHERPHRHLDDYLTERGVRGPCEIILASPLATPVPPSPETSAALLSAFAERNLPYFGDRDVISLDVARKIATLEDGTEIGYDIFLGVPKHHAPDVVLRAG